MCYIVPPSNNKIRPANTPSDYPETDQLCSFTTFISTNMKP